MLIENPETIVLPLVKEWIQDLVNIGMSYSRISCRLNLSPSTIQKIAKKIACHAQKRFVILRATTSKYSIFLKTMEA